MVKKHTPKQGWAGKLMNAGLIALGFSRVIEIIATRLTARAPQFIPADIVHDATFGLADGNFDLNAGLRMYTPAAGAIALGKLKQYLMRKFPVRR